MIDAIISGILHFFSTMLSALVAPLDTIISQYLPDVSTALTSFGNFVSSILQVIPWILSWFHIPAHILTIVVTWAIAKIWLNLGVRVFKIMLAWWRTLKI